VCTPASGRGRLIHATSEEQGKQGDEQYEQGIANVEADIAYCAQVDQLDTAPRLAHTVGHAAEIVV
jgi:hypothetical protein